jgi:hypothetical protein
MTSVHSLLALLATTDLTGSVWPTAIEGTATYGTVVDHRGERPTFLMGKDGATLTIDEAYRPRPTGWEGVESRTLAEILPGYKPAASHFDVCRALVVVTASRCTIRIGRIASCVGVVLMPRPDGTLGTGNRVEIGEAVGGRFHVMFAAQRLLSVDIGKATLDLMPTGPAGHVVYANETWLGDKYLRSVGVTIRIGQVRSAGDGKQDHVTLKLKGVDGASCTIEDDRNEGGCFDSIDSSGTVSVGSFAPAKVVNPVFGAFRTSYDQWGTGRRFGKPLGSMMVVASSFVLPAGGVPAYRIETADARFSAVAVRGGAPGVVWPGCSTEGVQQTVQLTQGLGSNLDASLRLSTGDD